MSRQSLLCIVYMVGVTVPVAALAAEPKEKSSPPDELARPAELVKIGLEAELAGNNQSRELHLQAALDLIPEFGPARWHLGSVRVGEEWLPVDQAAIAAGKLPQYSAYRSKRDELGGSVKKELALARWCEKEGMTDRAMFHYARVLNHPGVEAAMAREMIKKLGLRGFEGQLRTQEEIAEMQREAAANSAAWKNYVKSFALWRVAVESDDGARVKAAREQMASVNDFHVVSLAEAQIPTASEPWSLELVRLLGRFPEPPATVALTRTAVLSPHEDVRSAAIKELKQRKLHDFVPLLLLGLRPTTKTQFLVKVGPDFGVDYEYVAVTEDATGRVVTGSKSEHRETPVTISVGRKHPWVNPQVWQELDLQRAQAELVAARAMDQAAQHEAQAAQENLLAQTRNANFYAVLEQTTGQAIENEPAKWAQWWKSYNEVIYQTPTMYYVSQYTVPVYRPFIRMSMSSCFVAGTPVYTESGPQPIESVRPGDRVLSQDPDTGEIAFKLVQNVTVRPPSKLRKLTLGTSEVVTTLGHPFWVNGTGWKMAKELEAGQSLHTLGGALKIDKVEELAEPDQAYNLVVADFNTYFVGSASVLVHDNLYRHPTLAKVPGLVEAGR